MTGLEWAGIIFVAVVGLGILLVGLRVTRHSRTENDELADLNQP